MSALVIYKSAYGSTKQYAEWIGNEINAKVTSAENFDIKDIDKYKIVVVGTYCRASSFVMAKFITENWEKLRGKKVILFSSSKTPVDGADAVKTYEKNVPEHIRKEITYFPLEGRFVFSRLSAGDRRIMKTGQFMTRLIMGEKMANDMVKDCDGVKKENIKPIIDKIKTFE